MNTEKTRKFNGKKAALLAVAAVVAVIMSATLILAACEPIPADPLMADETYMRLL